MHKQSNPAASRQQDLFPARDPSPTAEQLLLALHHLDTDGKEAIAAIIIKTAKAATWFKRELIAALQQQLEEDRALDAWIETEELRHTDPYAGSKEGDGAYWTQ